MIVVDSLISTGGGSSYLQRKKKDMINYEFVNYTDPKSMHDFSTSIRIRQHAMKQVGVTRTKSQGSRRGNVEQPRVGLDSSQGVGLVRKSQAAAFQSMLEGRIVDDRALYDASIRSLSCKIDPFETASISIDVVVRRLIRYFTFWASKPPNTWTYSSSPFLPNQPAEHGKSISRTISTALNDDLIGNSLLATAASRLCYVEEASQPQIEEKELSMTQEALRLLRIRLNNTTTKQPESVETLVAATLHLGGAAFYKGDVVTAGLHIEAAVTLVNRIGGISMLRDPYIRGRLVSFDDLVSCVELRPCMIDSSTYDPGPTPPAAPKEETMMNDGVECTAEDLLVPHCPILPSTLQLIVLQILRCYQTERRILSSDGTSSSEALANQQWLALHTLSIRNGILAYSTTDSRTDVVRIALLLWTLLPHEDIAEATIANAIAPSFKYRLEQIPPRAWLGFERIWMWCLLIGHCCSARGTESRMYFARTISDQLMQEESDRPIELYVLKEIEIERNLIELQRSCLYHRPVQQGLSRGLATEIACRWRGMVSRSGLSIEFDTECIEEV